MQLWKIISLKNIFVTLGDNFVTLGNIFVTLGDIFVNHILRGAKYYINVILTPY